MAKPEVGDRGTTRVLVVDDHDRFRIGLAAILSQEGFTVEAAASGAAALESALDVRPDVVLMDVDMPGLSGVEATRQVAEAMPAVRVVMLGYHEEGMIEAIRAGACGYLGKDSSLEQLIAAINAAARGDYAFSPRVMGALVVHVRAPLDGGTGMSQASRRLRKGTAIDLQPFQARLRRAAA